MQDQLVKINYTEEDFTKKFRKFNTGKLKPEEVAILTDVYSIMDLSRGNPRFYDKNYQDYYAIYTRKRVKENYNIKDSKIGSIFKHLVKLGYLIRKRAKSGVMKLFTPFLSFTNKRKKQKYQENNNKEHSSNNNQRLSTHSKKQSNSNSKYSSKTEIESKDEAKSSTRKDMYDQYLPKKNSQYETNNQLDNFQQALREKNVPESAIKAAFNAYHDYDSLYKLFGIIFNSKNKALKESLTQPQDYFASLQVKGYKSLELDDIKDSETLIKKNIKDAFRFEKNKRMTKGLAFNIRTILSDAKYKANKFDRYTYGAFKKCFHKVAEQYVNNFIREMMDISMENMPNIPIIRKK